MNQAIARKDHKCCECGCVILKGQTCISVNGLWEDSPTYYWCLQCDDIRQELLPRCDRCGVIANLSHIDSAEGCGDVCDLCWQEIERDS
jgi:hypothetical protein